MLKYIINPLLSFIICATAVGQTVKAEEAKYHIGKTATVCGKIFNGRYLKSAKNKPTLLNMGGAFPNHQMTVVIFEEDLKQFPSNPENYYANTDVCVTGNIVEYNGKPEIVARMGDQIKIVPIVGGGSKTTGSTKAATAGPALPQKNGYEITLSVDVNLRAGAGMSYPSLTVLKAGTVVLVSSSSNGWSFVSVVRNDKDTKTTGLQGYIKNNVLK